MSKVTTTYTWYLFLPLRSKDKGRNLSTGHLCFREVGRKVDSPPTNADFVELPWSEPPFENNVVGFRLLNERSYHIVFLNNPPYLRINGRTVIALYPLNSALSIFT